MSASAGNVPPPTQALLPEVEWRGWQSVAQQLDESTETQGEACGSPSARWYRRR